jgi:hypothetical protein
VNDTLRDAGIAVLTTWLLSGLLQQRAEHAVRSELSRTVKGGAIHSSVQPSGLLGLFAGRSSITRVWGGGFSADGMPFRLESGRSADVHVRRLLVDFRDFTLKGVDIRQFTADIPNVDLDGGKALFHGRVTLRRAQDGTAQALITEQAVQKFLERKFPQIRVQEVRLTLGTAFLRGTMPVGSSPAEVEVQGGIAISEGRYLNLDHPKAKVNGRPIPDVLAAGLAKQFTPILDSVVDLGIGEVFRMRGINIGSGILTIKGDAAIPMREKKH